MSIERKVQLVEKLYHQLEQESAQFELSSEIHCIASCGICCTYPSIEASPLEFFPWAFHLFLKGEAEEMLHQLNKSSSHTCHVYKALVTSNKGRCRDYKDRGLICRLFGSAANTNKYGKLQLVTCKIIKEEQDEKYQKTAVAITEGLPISVFTEYYMQLNNIDFHLGNMMLPINKALKMALEEVLRYYAYRTHPEVLKTITS